MKNNILIENEFITLNNMGDNFTDDLTSRLNFHDLLTELRLMIRVNDLEEIFFKDFDFFN